MYGGEENIAEKIFSAADNFLQNTRHFACKTENAEIPDESKYPFKMTCVQNYFTPQYIVSDKLKNRYIL